VNVYLIALGPGRYEPYYEHEDADETVEAGEGQGLFARLSARFSAIIRDAERQRHEHTHAAPRSRMARLQRRMMGWVAERVAEQRLLWRLRSEEAAVLHLPEGMDPDEGLRVFHTGLQKDGDRHRLLATVHGLGLLASAPFAIIPGPNLFGYFFTFTAVGHFLSYRGARRGQSQVRWTVQSSAVLRELADAVGAPAPGRFARIHAAADRLRLPHLARFVERMTASAA
jgi:hypothetical protein